MGPYGSQNFKRYSSLKSLLNLFNLFLNFNFLSVVFTKVLFWIFEILNFRFLTIFLISPLYPMRKPKTSIIWKTSDRIAKQSEIWASGGEYSTYSGYF